MARLALLDAPIDCSGAGRGEERAPAALRAAGLVERLGARDAGEADGRIRDRRRDPDTGVVGAGEVRRASIAIASGVREVLDARERPLVLGGDCTLLLGVFQAVPPGSGLWFVDGHADFFDGESSPTGEAADMDLAILTGHGPPGLLECEGPLVEPAAVVLLGHRPSELHPDVARENARLDRAIHALTVEEIRVSVDEPEAAAGGHRLEDAEQQRAVAPEDERTLASVQHLAHTGCDRHRRPAHLDCADNAGIWVPSLVTDAPVGPSGITRTETFDHPGRAQRRGRVFLPSSCPRAVNRGVEHGQASHSLPFFRDFFRRVADRSRLNSAVVGESSDE